MRLEDYTIVARKRDEWEVLDLGTLLFQSNLGTIMRSGLLLAIPMLAITCALVLPFGFFWGYLFLWLMRPLYGRVTLLILSRAVFASHLTPREVARALPKFIFQGWLSAVLIRPWTLSRVIVEPVRLLEGLKGKELGKRSQVLLGEGVRSSVWWGALSVSLVQFCLLASILALVLGFAPEGAIDWELEGGLANLSTLVAWLVLIAMALSFAVVEPLWVAIGFAIYLNRRSDLEGWDVELVFRKLAQRVSQGVRLSGLAVIGLLTCLPRMLGFQDSDPVSESMRPVDRVFARPEFSTTETRWVETSGPQAPDWLLDLFVITAYIGVGCLVAWLLYLLVRWAMGVEAPDLRAKEPEVEGALELAGLDLRRESLPKDLVGEARALWAAGHARDAISLLYRGSLVVLRDEHGLFIEDGDTEGRCLRKVVALDVAELGTYFGGLTDLWIRLAYGGERLEEAAFGGLAEGYSENFGGRR